MTVYWANVEFDIVNPEAYENCVGGFVYLFFGAKDVQDAIPKIKDVLGEENLKVNSIEFIAPYEEIPWVHEEDQALYDGLAREAETSGDVVWDEISAYESKEE